MRLLQIHPGRCFVNWDTIGLLDGAKLDHALVPFGAQSECSRGMISDFVISQVINDKLNHCVELVDLLSSHLSDRHHIRLEWMIIILIMVEVGFEILHYAERFLG